MSKEEKTNKDEIKDPVKEIEEPIENEVSDFFDFFTDKTDYEIYLYRRVERKGRPKQEWLITYYNEVPDFEMIRDEFGPGSYYLKSRDGATIRGVAVNIGDVKGSRRDDNPDREFERLAKYKEIMGGGNDQLMIKIVEIQNNNNLQMMQFMRESEERTRQLVKEIATASQGNGYRGLLEAAEVLRNLQSGGDDVGDDEDGIEGSILDNPRVQQIIDSVLKINPGQEKKKLEMPAELKNLITIDNAEEFAQKIFESSKGITLDEAKIMVNETLREKKLIAAQ